MNKKQNIFHKNNKLKIIKFYITYEMNNKISSNYKSGYDKKF